MDGVLLDGEMVKVRCWRQAVADVLRPQPATLRRLHAYNLGARGIPRSEKFRFAADVVKAPSGAVEELLLRYGQLLSEESGNVLPFEGSIEFVARWPGRTAVVSSAPREEVAHAMKTFGFGVDAVFGFPTTKAQALREMKSRSANGVAFFGDAAADRRAAREAGVSFVAIGSNMSRAAGDVAWFSSLKDALEVEEILSISCSGVRTDDGGGR